VLLTSPEKAWALSDLACQAQVSLGMTHKVLAKLQREQLVDKDIYRKWSLSNPAQLLDEWSLVYRSRQQQRRNFFSLAKTPQLLINEITQKLGNYGFALSFSSGANIITPFLRGLGTLQVYLRDTQNLKLWQKSLDLKEVSRGHNLEIYTPFDQGVFYGTRLIDDVPIVGDVQLYLDTLTDPARGGDLARHLRERKLSF
jgi:hypothetical protein